MSSAALNKEADDLVQENSRLETSGNPWGGAILSLRERFRPKSFELWTIGSIFLGFSKAFKDFVMFL